MVVSYSLEDQEISELAKVLLINEAGRVVSQINFMLKTEWIREEQAFKNLVATAGLQMQEVQRVNFHDEDARQWMDLSAEQETHTALRYSQLQEEGRIKPEWSNADGTFSR